jgi:hypothetical protein
MTEQVSKSLAAMPPRAECRDLRRHNVDAREFLELMMSSRKLDRAIGLPWELCGLVDRETGDQFVVEREKLTP